MKNLKYLFYTLLATSVFAACSEDTTSPAEPDLENCYNVYFPSQDNAANLTLDPAAPTSLEFTVMRSNDKDAITVPVEIIASEEDIFTASEVVFAEGQTETTFSVDFPKAALGTTYSCTLAVTDPQYVSKYTGKPAFVKFSVLRAKWIPVEADRVITYNGQTATGYTWYTEDVVTTLFGTGVNTIPVKVEVREDTTDEDYPNGPNGLGGLYRMLDPYLLYPYNLGPYIEGTNIEIDATDPMKVFIRTQKMGYERDEAGYGTFIISSKAYFYMQNGGDPDAYYGKIENGTIVFPTDALLFGMSDYNDGGLYSSNSGGAFRLEICSELVVDYSLILTAGEPADGEIAIAAEFGADVAKVKYAFFEGTLSAVQVNTNSADIDAGTVESKELTAEGTVSAQFEKTGVYTMVANIYDKDNQLQGCETVSFGYVAAGDEKPVVLSCGINITDRYKPQGYTSEDSAEIYIYGENIVSGFYALIETDKMAAIENMDEYLSKSGKEFTAAQLEQINGTGFSGVIGDLVGGTEYTLVVKAFNGYVSATFTATATTNGTPHPLKRTYAASDLSEVSLETLYAAKWNYYAVDYLDKNNNKRQYIGEVTVSEHTAPDENGVALVNVKGLSGLAGDSNFSGDDTMSFEWEEGLLYSLAKQQVGTYANYPVSYYMVSDDIGGYNANYALVGGIVDEGYIAFVGNPGYIQQNSINFVGFWFAAFTDETLGSKAKDLALFYNIMLVNPAVDDTTPAETASKTVSLKSLRNLAANAATPNNFVELRGRERMRALIDEMKANKRVDNMVRTIEPVAMPALGVAAAKVTFEPGLPQKTFDRSLLKVKGNAVRFDN